MVGLTVTVFHTLYRDNIFHISGGERLLSHKHVASVFQTHAFVEGTVFWTRHKVKWNYMLVFLSYVILCSLCKNISILSHLKLWEKWTCMLTWSLNSPRQRFSLSLGICVFRTIFRTSVTIYGDFKVNYNVALWVVLMEKEIMKIIIILTHNQ